MQAEEHEKQFILHQLLCKIYKLRENIFRLWDSDEAVYLSGRESSTLGTSGHTSSIHQWGWEIFLQNATLQDSKMSWINPCDPENS